MEQIRIVALNEKISAEFYGLAEEYLPGSDLEKMRTRAELFPKAFIALVLDGEVIGVCFGWGRRLDVPEDPSFVLDGIAVREDYQKMGCGKRLLGAFEKAAADYGYPTVSVGSAGGYVEKFYIDCGFTPKEYKVWDRGVCVVERAFADIEDYFSYERKNPDGFVVMEKERI